MALQLKRTGITRIRPLQGGLNLWMTREFPTERFSDAAIAPREPSATPTGGG